MVVLILGYALVLVSSISNFFSNKISHANKSMREKNTFLQYFNFSMFSNLQLSFEENTKQQDRYSYLELPRHYHQVDTI